MILNILYSVVDSKQMVDNHNGDNNIEESVIAKSTGQQEEKDIALKDAALYSVLKSKKKMTKQEAGYKEQDERKNNNNNYNQACIKCNFNLPDEKSCHIVEGAINNQYTISNFFSPKLI
jgi:hypothetical protein